MPAAGRRGRLDGMYPQLVGDPLQSFDIDIIHECSKLYSRKAKRKVERGMLSIPVRLATAAGVRRRDMLAVEMTERARPRAHQGRSVRRLKNS